MILSSWKFKQILKINWAPDSSLASFVLYEMAFMEVKDKQETKSVVISRTSFACNFWVFLLILPLDLKYFPHLLYVQTSSPKSNSYFFSKFHNFALSYNFVALVPKLRVILQSSFNFLTIQSPCYSYNILKFIHRQRLKLIATLF